jgi:hypothetical protein
MTEQKYIETIKSKNPKLFNSEEIRIRPNVLESVLRQAFRAGTEETKAAGDFFQKIFSGKK